MSISKKPMRNKSPEDSSVQIKDLRARQYSEDETLDYLTFMKLTSIYLVVEQIHCFVVALVGPMMGNTIGTSA